MRLRRLWIKHFRGIRTLDWTLPAQGRLQVLVGPGDSGKSTILDAIHYLLGDRWSIPFSDDDFYDVDVESPIAVRALLTDLTPDLLRESAFGLWLSGVDDEGQVHPEPTDDLLPGLLTQLSVDSTLEPRWSVTRHDGTSQPVSAGQRKAFSTFRVDDRTDTQLRWTRNSALGRMSAKEGADRRALSAASRAARDALAQQENSSLEELAKKVQDAANALGGGRFHDVKAGLDTSRSSMGAALALYEGVVPLTSYGLGSRRLMSLTVQQLATEGRAVALVDELEHGLEPHRAVQLLRHLAADDEYAHVLVSTHSPVVVEQADLQDLATVQNRDGLVTVTSLGGDAQVLQRLQRGRPSSFLARRVVIGEGKTEHGVLLECVQHWDGERAAAGLSSAAGEGVVLQEGAGGSEVGPRAQTMSELGYAVAGLCDNDVRTDDVGLDAAAAAGVLVVRWEDGNHIEAQVCSQIGIVGLQSFVSLGEALRHHANTVLDDLRVQGLPAHYDTLHVETWVAEHSLDEVRAWIVAAAVQRKWFKDVDSGRALGRWIIEHYDRPGLAATTERLERIRSFIYPPAAEDLTVPEAVAAPTDGTLADG